MGKVAGGAGRVKGIRPRVGVSACLLGHEVRWDGGHKRNAVVAGELARRFELVPVCPEVAIGLGVPREPIQLVAVPGGGGAVHLLGVRDGADHTAAMERFARAETQRLAREGLDGWIFKVRSPSCGPAGVPVWGASEAAERGGPGLFARLVAELLPGLPVSDEESLEEPGERRRFVAAVAAYRRRRAERS